MIPDTRRCPKCRLFFDAQEYGDQSYCRSCWRTYNNGRRKKFRRKKRQKRDHWQSLVDKYLAFSAEGRKEHENLLDEAQEAIADLPPAQREHPTKVLAALWAE